jgi:type IV pilus assembly protein PilB
LAKYIKLGDLLTSSGAITHAQLDKALQMQKISKKRLGQVLIDNDIISEMQLIEALRMQLGIEFVDLSKVAISPEMTRMLPKGIARKYQMVPIKLVGNDLYIAMSDPLNFVSIEEAKASTKRHIIPMISTSAAVSRAIVTLYGNEGVRLAIEDMKRESSEDGVLVFSKGTNLIGEDDSSSAPAIRLANSIIERGIGERASDIHLEPQEDLMVVRMRIDGIIHSILTVPKELQPSLISRIKIMCGMEVTERRIPQDGRALVRIKMREIDLRASTIPTLYGEKVVLRLLDKDAQILTPEGLGIEGENLKKYRKLLSLKQGVVLMVGPTGSGKSSTMYTMLEHLNTEAVNIITLEDPVEYSITGINQVQINEKLGMTFASGLRSILRQDPDIIGVGEIRDGITAEIAMRAAITGHLVLSTVHTSGVLSALDRLADMDVAPYMVSSALEGLISQRLVRRICPQCREEYQPSVEDLIRIGMPPEEAGHLTLYRGKGCPECFDTGYRGRIAVFEMLLLNDAIRRAIHEQLPHAELIAAIKASGFTSLADNCRILVREGVTSAQEMARTINIID